MEISKERFKRLYPNLEREMQSGKQKVTINSVRHDTGTQGKAAPQRRNLDHFDPDIIDFLRRCDTAQQAREIIAYMENRGEITRSYAGELRRQLQQSGVRSFGPKKEEGYYLKSSSGK